MVGFDPSKHRFGRGAAKPLSFPQPTKLCNRNILPALNVITLFHGRFPGWKIRLQLISGGFTNVKWEIPYTYCMCTRGTRIHDSLCGRR